MAKSRSVTIGELHFTRVGDAKEYVRKIVRQYPRGGRVLPIHVDFFKDLLDLHPRAAEKIGSGVIGFEIQKNPAYPNTFTIYFLRPDGSKCDFSWIKCVDGEKREALQHAALRRAIMNQIVTFRDSQLYSGQPLLCPVMHTKITLNDYHVDHVAPHSFNKLVDDWLASEHLGIEDIEITSSQDNQYSRDMANSAQLHSWQQFHYERAVLQMLSSEGNLRLPKHKYKK
jgi:hypothetical protein